MRSQLFLIPAALIAPAAARAEIYLDFEQAKQLLYPDPGVTFTQEFRALTDEQIDAVTKASDATVWERKVKVWRVSTGGWLFLDQVVGRDDWISFALAVDATGAVTGIEVLECLERWNQVTMPEWRAQFKGRKRGKIKLGENIEIISSTTLSSIHLTEGVNRLLATLNLVIAPKKKG